MVDEKQVPVTQRQSQDQHTEEETNIQIHDTEQIAAISTQQSGDTHTTPADSNILSKIMEMMGGLNSQMEHITKKIDQNMRKVDGLEENINKNMEKNNQELNDKIDRLEANIYRKMEENFVEINENIMKKVEEKSAEIEGKVVNLENKVTKINEEIDEKIKASAKEIKSNISLEAEHLIVEGLTTIDSRMKEHEDTTKELEGKVNSNMRLLNERYIHTPNYTNIQTHTCTKTPFYYYGDNRTHPKIFITRLKQHMETLHPNANLKINIQGMMKGQAEFWYELIEDKFETLEEFEVLILKQYWSEHSQQKVRFNLFNGKYNEELGISRENYILRKVYNIRYLEPEFNESEMVRYLARHFETDIYNVIITQRIVTLEGLIEYLRGIDDHRTGWRKPIYRDNRQNVNRNYENVNRNRNYDNRQDVNRNYENVNLKPDKNFDHIQNTNKGNENVNQYRNYGNNNYRNYNNAERDYNTRNNNNGQQRKPTYDNQNNQIPQNQEDRKVQDNRRDNRTYAQVTNTNVHRKENGGTHTQADVNKIETMVQINTRPDKSDF